MKDLFNSTVILSPSTATIITSLVLPLMVAVLAKLTAPAWVKSLINLVLATVLAVVTLLNQAGVTGVPMKRLLSLVIVTMVGSDIAYNYVWKPIGIWPLIQKWTSGFGFGGGASEQPLNPDPVLTPPPGGFGEGGSAHQFMELNERDMYGLHTGIPFPDGSVVLDHEPDRSRVMAPEIMRVVPPGVKKDGGFFRRVRKVEPIVTNITEIGTEPG